MKNWKDIQAELLELNDENSKKHDHVCRVFSDGKLTMQKGGDLLGLRNEHMIRDGLPGQIPAHWFPNQTQTHGYIWCSYEKGEKIRKKIVGWIREWINDPLWD